MALRASEAIRAASVAVASAWSETAQAVETVAAIVPHTRSLCCIPPQANRGPVTAETGHEDPDNLQRAENQPAASCGLSGDDVDARAAVEGHQSLGLTVLDPRTGERVSL